MKYYRKLMILGMATWMMGTQTYGATLEGILESNTTLVPLRIIGQELNAKVNFDANTQGITVKYKDKVIKLEPGSKEADINGELCTLSVAPKISEGVTYIPLRFIGEALDAKVNYEKGIVTIRLEDIEKSWELKLQQKQLTKGTLATSVKSETKTIKGKVVKYVSINMNDANVKVQVNTAGNKINEVTALKEMAKASNAIASINGTYFAAYNGDTPFPDGTIIKNGKPLHITDIGCTIGFTPDNKVLIDFITTRVQGYVNGVESWISYRVNRPTPDPSATVIYTPEYGGSIPLSKDNIAVVCQNNKVIKKVNTSTKVPQGGFILAMDTGRSARFQIGDQVDYKVTFNPKNTSSDEWKAVTHAISAGPSLLINNKYTPEPKDEGFTEDKILTQAAQRSFIGVTKENKLIMGITSANITDLKAIVKELGLESAMCLDGGASSGLYYNGQYITNPGRNINNTLNFIYNK